VGVESFLRNIFRIGELHVTLPGGKRLEFGDGSEPKVAVSISDRATVLRIMSRPSLGVGEAYMDGRLTLERGSIRYALDLAARNSGEGSPWGRPNKLAQWWARSMRERNARRAARRNVEHHYDLSLELYRSFLDEDLQYSCAYFASPGVSLDEAQLAKKRRIAAKLCLRPALRVLDIGCGWGGLAISLAEWNDASVDGMSLSQEQVETARARAEGKGLSDRVRFSLTDYRDAVGPYDRIVSVGMFEHVGRPNYQAFFDKVAGLLAKDGVAVIHSIGRAEPPSATDPFTQKYISPGVYVPALSEVLPAVERAGLRVTDMEILRVHYAETLRHWYQNFQARRAKVAAIYDERFCRMWEYYLCMSEMGFRYRGLMVFQLQLAKRFDAVPITRDYIAANENRLRAGSPA
jgi:cyclopropane-fatty-acyl-phospholipid synthase